MKLCATKSFDDVAAATDFTRSVTNGQAADAAIVTVGVTTAYHVAQAFTPIRKAGTCVLI